MHRGTDAIAAKFRDCGILNIALQAASGETKLPLWRVTCVDTAEADQSEVALLDREHQSAALVPLLGGRVAVCGSAGASYSTMKREDGAKGYGGEP